MSEEDEIELGKVEGVEELASFPGRSAYRVLLLSVEIIASRFFARC